MFDALVIGAGPAGAAAARLLAQAGWAVALVEKSAFPRAKVCGEFISAPSLAVLEACGIAEAFARAAGPPVLRIALFAGETIVVAPAPAAPWGRALDRAQLDTLLRDAAVAAGVTLFQPREVTALERRGETHYARLDDGSVLMAHSVIAACGSWRTKPPFAVTAPDGPGDLFAFKAHFSGGALAQGMMPLLAFPGGYGGMVRSDGGRLSLSCCIRRDRLAALRRPGERAGEAVLRHLCATTRGVREALAGAEAQDGVMAAGPIRPGIRPRSRDGIFFTGNLAGEAHPVIAEGISMAMQASALLARHLIAAGAHGNLHGAGAAYAADWLKRFAPRLLAASLFAHAAMAARGPGAAVVKNFPALLNWGAAASGKVKR